MDFGQKKLNNIDKLSFLCEICYIERIDNHVWKKYNTLKSILRHFLYLIKQVIKINSLNISNSKELKGFVSSIIYVWFYILFILLFAQNFDNIKQM